MYSMLHSMNKFCRQNPLIMIGWLLLIISLALPAFSSEKGVIYGFEATVIGGVYAMQLIIVDLFVVDGLITPRDDINQLVASPGVEHLLWMVIYLSIAVASLANLLFLSVPLILRKSGENKKRFKCISKML